MDKRVFMMPPGPASAPPRALVPPAEPITRQPPPRAPTGPLASRAPRFNTRLPVQFGPHQTALEERGVLINLSRTGLSMKCGRPQTTGTRLSIGIPMPGTGLARINGEVAWCRPVGNTGQCTVGIRLHATDAPFLELIAEVQQRE